jgi:hypothetical protein
MKFTFGIITTGSSDDRINLIIDSIEQQNVSIPEYEIIIVGNSSVSRDRTRIISFDDNQKYDWITKKKNLITENAQYDNIVYSHDYIFYDSKWYEEWLKFGDDYKVCMNRILNEDETRYRDWCIWPYNGNFMDDIVALNAEERQAFPQRADLMEGLQCLIPYNITHLSKYMYFSGAYWVGKKYIMGEFPLNEELSWSQGEDVEWSMRIREKYNFSINSKSIVRLLKYKGRVFDETDFVINKMLEDSN